MNRLQVSSMSALITAFLVASPGQTQTAAVSDPEKFSFAAQKSEPALTDTLPALLSSVSIEAGQSNGKATLNLHQSAGQVSLVGTISAPLNKDAQPTDLASLTGLAADFSASISASGFIFPQMSPTKAAAQDSICKMVHADPNECDTTGIKRAVALDCGFDVKPPDQNGVGVKESEVEAKVDQLLLTASSAQLGCFNNKYPPAERAFLAASLGRVQSWAMTGEVGHKVANFFRADGGKDKETDLPYAVSASYGWIGSTWLASVRGRYETRYTEGDAANHCKPLAGADSSAGLASCEQLPFGAPTRSRAFVATAEARWYIAKFAVSPVVAYDFKKKVLGLQLPIYLVRNSDGQLTGGFRLGWRDDTHALTASVFISKPLSIGD
jgi:hypothetical protein